MDVRDISQVVVLKNCARTNGSDTIGGNAVTGVQTHSPIEDDLSAAETYYGPGEVVVTDPYGVTLTAGTATTAVPAIHIRQRSYDGTSHFNSMLTGKDLKSYVFTPYKARSPQVTVLHTIDATLTDHTYMIKIRRLGSDAAKLKDPTVKTAYFKSASGGSTATQIVTGLAAYINTNFNNDKVMPISAAVGGASNDALILTALPYTWELGKDNYKRLKFDVTLVNFTGTLVNNMYADLTYNSITYDHATDGAGTYEQVAEMEYYAKMYTGANRDIMSPAFKRHIVAMDAQKYEDDGTTLNRYDTIVLNWERATGDFSNNVRQQGSIVMFFPMDNNGTNQQAAVLAVLNAYAVTAHGVGSAITLST